MGRECLEPEGQPKMRERAGECGGCGTQEGDVINCDHHYRETGDT